MIHVKERNGNWFWIDEEGEWHGPVSSRESAQKRRSLYLSYLRSEINICNDWDWEKRKDREKSGTVHPCNVSEPWDCDCCGSCSCHWEEANGN